VINSTPLLTSNSRPKKTAGLAGRETVDLVRSS
jgi:hypothetical protein